MRLSELCNLKAKQILRQKKAIRIIQGKKSIKRFVPISKRVHTLLEHYFAINDDWPVGPRQAQKIVKQVANKAKLSQTVTPHILRRTFATLALQKGISQTTVKGILGCERLGRWDVTERMANLRIVYDSSEEIFNHIVLQDLGFID